MVPILEISAGLRGVELTVILASWAGTVHGRDPEIGGTRVEDDSEILRWGANGDDPKVFRILVIDEGLINILVLGAGISELDHIQLVGLPELGKLAPFPQGFPNGFVSPQGHPE